MDENQEQSKDKMHKTRRAFDWFCACLIRLPAIALLEGLLVTAVFLVTLIVSPESAKEAWTFLIGGMNI